MKKTLLEKAKEFNRHRKGRTYTDEHFEVTKAWLKDEIGISQIAKAMDAGNNQIGATMLLYALKEMYKKGILKF